MSMGYVLIATSTGDDLISPKDSVVAVSTERAKLEELMQQRGKERAEYLATHEIPWWAKECITKSERIVEVESV